MRDETRYIIRCTWRGGELQVDRDVVVVEVPVALVYNEISHVVMMATPANLEDLAMGFSLSEGILQRPRQLLDVEIHERDKGLEVAMRISAEAFATLKQRRRNLTGRTGCGLCGLESLDQAVPAPVTVSGGDYAVSHRALQRALKGLERSQSLKNLTGGVHGAAWCNARGEVELLREDIGRHNALDKLLGALQRAPHTREGFVLVTSRASYEMVAKAASCNVPILAAVSASTTLAVAQAEASGMTLVAFVQPDRQVIYTHPQRIVEQH